MGRKDVTGPERLTKDQGLFVPMHPEKAGEVLVDSLSKDVAWQGSPRMDQGNSAARPGVLAPRQPGMAQRLDSWRIDAAAPALGMQRPF